MGLLGEFGTQLAVARDDGTSASNSGLGIRHTTDDVVDSQCHSCGFDFVAPVSLVAMLVWDSKRRKALAGWVLVVRDGPDNFWRICSTNSQLTRSLNMR